MSARPNGDAGAGSSEAEKPAQSVDSGRGRKPMSEHDEGRRAFIVGAVGAGAVAGTSLVQTAYAKTPQGNKTPHGDQPHAKTAAAPVDANRPAEFDGHGVFFND